MSIAFIPQDCGLIPFICTLLSGIAIGVTITYLALTKKKNVKE